MTSTEISFYRQAVREGNLAALRLFLKDFDSKDKEHQASLVITGVTEAPSLKVLKSLLTMGIPLDFVEEEKQNKNKTKQTSYFYIVYNSILIALIFF